MEGKPRIYRRGELADDADEIKAGAQTFNRQAKKQPHPFERRPELFDPENVLHRNLMIFEGSLQAAMGTPLAGETEPPPNAMRNPITGIHAMSHGPHGMQEPQQQKKLD